MLTLVNDCGSDDGGRIRGRRHRVVATLCDA